MNISLAQNGNEEQTRVVIAPECLRPKEPITLNRPGEEQELVEQVGRYRILERLGHGGMAAVYRAHDPDIDRTLAIKFLHTNLCRDEQYRARFLRESQVAGVLSHPNIVTVFDVGEIESRPYIAMELVEGVPLSETIASGALLSMREVVEIGMQLGSALDYAHRKGIFHRDIKPSNIITLKGTNTIKVTDFGIARTENSELTVHTRMGDVLGTPQYMSPEQALGQKVDGRSDLFSTGVVLYQLITGQQLFEADSIASLMYRIAKEEPRPIEQLRSDIPPGLRRIVERCLAKKPEKRFQTGQELHDALSRVKRELEEEAAEKAADRIIPLRVKWALLVTSIVAVTMAVTATVVIQRQYASMMGQVMDYGASLTRFMATELAVPVLSEEWVAVEVFANEVIRTQDFHHIIVVDRQGTVRVSNDTDLVGKPYARPAGAVLESNRKGVTVHSRQTAGQTVLDFQGPVTFQGREIAKVHLGIPEAPLSRVARLSMSLMAMLVVITVASVFAATYVVGKRFSKPMQLLRDSMGEIAKGRFDHRIGIRRNDEIGQLFQSFDEMSQALHQREEKPSEKTS
jgi:eukaryotic-like serine/threonine-protein kinase